MNFDEYTVGDLERGRVQIMFTEPITRDWEISLFMQFFEKHKTKIAVSYKLKPKVTINGLICKQKTWNSFLKFIRRETAEIDFERETKPMDYNELTDYLETLKEAGMKEQARQLSMVKERNEKTKKNN